MKFENIEVEQMYYDLHKRYKVGHVNFGDSFSTIL